MKIIGFISDTEDRTTNNGIDNKGKHSINNVLAMDVGIIVNRDIDRKEIKDIAKTPLCLDSLRISFSCRTNQSAK